MTKLIVANWKMNGSLKMAHDFCTQLTDDSRKTPIHNTLVICPPHPYLSFVTNSLVGSGIKLGAQDCATAQKGSYTGDTSAEMLRDIGCSYVLVGHSERRQNHKESKDLLAQKLQQASQENLIPIFCIGEREIDYDNKKTKEVLKEQLSPLKTIPIQLQSMDSKTRVEVPQCIDIHEESEIPRVSKTHRSKEDGDIKLDAPLVIAYEPIWAIGTGKVPTLDEIQETCLFIKETISASYGLTPPILYGGSVKADNASSILSLNSVGGVLVGGASLNPQSFWSIATALC